MNKNRLGRYWLAVVMIVAVGGAPLSPVSAALVETEQLLAPALTADRLPALLADEQARQALIQYGVDPHDVEQRLAQLTAEERTALARQLAELPAGGDVLSVLLVVFVVFVITDALGATDIFPFVHPIK